MRAIYAGSFDPLTLGHTWMIEQGILLFDELIVAIGENPQKKYFFSVEERLKMIKEEYLQNKIKIKILTSEYLVNYAEETGCEYMIRGIRNSEDFQYENMLKEVNLSINPNIKTVFFMPPKELSVVSSSMVKSLIGPKGWENELSKYLPSKVHQHILNRKG
jgi:pantetheine-phosphate adenylyltransferase